MKIEQYEDSRKWGNHVKCGASVPKGLRGCQLLTDLKLGNIMLTLLPMDKSEALAVANYCRENRIYFLWSELLWRGTTDLCYAARKVIPREEFYTKEEFEEICRAGGPYYIGRFVVGEIGGLLYGPKSYWIDRTVGDWESLPTVETVDEAKRVYIEEIKKWLDYELSELGDGPLVSVDAGCTFKYLLEAGLDIPGLEVMPGDATLMMAAARGAATAYGNRDWGIHVAMSCYGGVALDALWQRRWKISLYSGFISGAHFVYPESGHFIYNQVGKSYAFDSPEMLETRRILREFNQFCQIHSRPAKGPRVKMGFIYGNLDGYPGLWNKYVWGQHGDDKWLFGPAEWAWELLDDVYRKGKWDDENIQGDVDFHGNAPFGQYDIVPIEASVDVLKEYSCLVFLGWNTMTEEIYEKLKSYVELGGHLIMSVPHLSTETDRAKDLTLFRGGDWRDLFGVVVRGIGKTGVAGIKTFNESTLAEYKMPVWRINTDPRFMGDLKLAKTEVRGARVISGWADYYFTQESDLLANPVLTEFSLGRGKAFLLNSWTYPGDKGWAPYVRDLLRMISRGEQGDIRIIGSDKIRYAVYDADGIAVVYLLNTEYDTPHMVDLWIDGKVCPRILVEPAEMNVVYIRDGIALSPEDRGVELEEWEIDGSEHKVRLFARRRMLMRVFNLTDGQVDARINDAEISLSLESEGYVEIEKRIDPGRAEFYADDFLHEPTVERSSDEFVGDVAKAQWIVDGLPY